MSPLDDPTAHPTSAAGKQAVDEHRVRRVLDANLNRASEGLRVVEEYARFILDDRHLSRLTKEIRHELSSFGADLGSHALQSARETQRDVGTTLATVDEYSRNELADVVTANQKRVEQSLRCLEEYSKLLRPQTAAGFEQLRYRCYTLGKALDASAVGVQRLANARLYVLLNGGPSAEAFESVASLLIDAGVDMLQLRDKSLEDRALLARARTLRQLTRGTTTQLIMNDRADLAALVDADGVHVGQDDLPVAEARSLVGNQRMVGVSTHSIEQARQAVLDGANYIGCGPTFPSETKSFDQFPGPQFLRDVAAEISLPAFAIGGISLARLAEVTEAGFHRVAVGAAVTAAEDPADVVRAFRAALE